MIYLAAPYAHENPDVMADRVAQVNDATRRMVKAGLRVFSPLTYSCTLGNESEPPDGWYEFDLDFLRLCDELIILLLPGVSDSKGVGLEHAAAREMGIPIRALDPRQVGQYSQERTGHPVG